MRNDRWASWAFSLTCLCLASSCTLLLERDKKQCSGDGDCDAPYLCGSAGLCEKQSGCSKDEDCRQPGICVDEKCEAAQCATSAECGDQLCDVDSLRCVPTNKASCETSEDCMSYDGAPVCVRATGRCSDSECVEKKDCGTSPTVKCTEGACVDPTWECLGEPDPRPAQNMSAEATFRLKVLYAYAQGGAKESPVADLDVLVCRIADPLCMNPIGVKWTYGEDHYLEIPGLEAEQNYRVQLTAKHPTKPEVEMMPGEYWMYRTVVGVTEDPKPVLMWESSVPKMLGVVAGVQVDLTLGMTIMRIFDCTDSEVEGVTVSFDKPTTGCAGSATPCSTFLFYQDVTNFPIPDATETNAAGRVGIVNMLPGVNNTITLVRSADRKKIASYIVVPRPGWVTYVNFWPQDYGTAQ